MKPKEFLKYDIPVPRYTSYPTVVNWKKISDTTNWKLEINSIKSSVDVYIHVPYCQQLCWYCGCNRIISKNAERGIEYATYLKKEWDLYRDENPSLVVSSIHFGGGTPNFLAPSILRDLVSYITNKDAPVSIELDPRTLTLDYLKELCELNIIHYSLGIQDFDNNVQTAINRIQPFELVKPLVTFIKKHTRAFVNFDLIYGLPLQTIQSINSTIQKVKSLRPNHIALYSYAHLPKVLKNQKLINSHQLPKSLEKRQLYEFAKEELLNSGYVEVGLDHFALIDSPLAHAKVNRSLKRSFMGYTDKKESTCIGLGASAISESNSFYIQNTKDLKEYFKILDRGELPIEKGIELNCKDKVNKKIIQNIMCNKLIESRFVEHKEEYLQQLQSLKVDGVVEEKNGYYYVTDKGLPFLRNIASIFDSYLASNKSNFSQSI